MYTMIRGWIDTADRCRTWKILTPSGEVLAEITTKRATLRLLDMLNGGAAK
jgi:hypothetical protein